MSLTYPSVAIQTNLTFTAKRWGQFPTISFTNGATAGSEVASVDSSNNITVQIQSGVTTMLQVKTAVDSSISTSGFAASDLVSVAVTGGHNSDTVVTVKNAALAGGTALTSARLTIGHLVYTAVTGGTGGNSIRVKYTSGGSLSVSVSSNDITVQLKNDGSSTNALIKAAIIASSPANALVTTASDGLAMSFVPTVAMATAFLSLSGGTAAVAPSKVLQDLTFASNLTGITHNGDTVTYTTGATAGSEVVSGTAAALSVQIQNGVSTATQIKAAVDAATSISANKASGTITYGSPSNGDTLVANGTTFTKAASGDATHFSTIAELTALIAGVSGLAASDDGTTITVVAATAGTAGNALTLAKTGSALVLSGATLAGGRDGILTTISGTGSTAQKTVNAASMSGASAATQPASPNEPPLRVSVIS